MQASDGTADDSGVPTLAELITEQKAFRGYSYRTLEARADSVITAQRWQQLGTGVRIKEFPEPATLQAMANALGVDVTAVVMAAARSIGLPVRRVAESDLAAMLPQSASLLTTDQRDAILAVVRSITRGATDAVVPVRSDPPAAPADAQDQARPREKTHALRRASSTARTQGSDLAAADRKPQDLTANAHPHGPDRWPDGQPVYDEHWDQWKAWQGAGAPPGAWEAFRAAERQQAYDLAARFIPCPTDKERMTTAQDQAAEAPHAESGDDPA